MLKKKGGAGNLFLHPLWLNLTAIAQLFYFLVIGVNHVIVITFFAG